MWRKAFAGLISPVIGRLVKMIPDSIVSIVCHGFPIIYLFVNNLT